MLRFISGSLIGFLACGIVSGQVDPAVARSAASLTVQSGGKDHKVGDEIAKLDQMRNKVLTSITEKTDNQDYNIGAELKVLDQLDRYSGKLADLVATQNPDAREATGWLQANAAAAGAWREAYTSTESFQDNSRLAELKAIETRLGHDFGGDLGKEISGLKATQDSASASAALEELGRRVRSASGLVSNQTGLIQLGLKMSPASVTQGDRVTLVVAPAMGGGGGGAGGAGGPGKESVTLEVAVSGPTTFSLGTQHKTFAPGYAVGGQGWFSINTGDGPLPEGVYTVTVSGTDTHGHTLSAMDTFEVELPRIVPIGGGVASTLSPAVITAFEAFAKSSGLTKLEFDKAANSVTALWDNPVGGGHEMGQMSVVLWKPPTDGMKNWKQLQGAQVRAVNGKEHVVLSYKSGNLATGTPIVTLYWMTKDLTCNVSFLQYQDWKDPSESDRALGEMMKRATTMDANLDAVITKAQEAPK